VSVSVPGILLRNWRLKGFSLLLAALLWVIMQLRDDTDTGRRDLPDVEVRVSMMDTEWIMLGTPSPATISLSVRGSFGDLFRAALARPVIMVPVDSVPKGDSTLELETSWVTNLDHNRVTVEGFDPASVQLRFERNTTEPVPVSYRTIGELPESLALTGEPRVNPLFVQAHGPASVVDVLETVFLEPLDLGSLTGPGHFELDLDTAGLEGIAVTPSTATLTVDAAPKDSLVMPRRPVELVVSGGFVLGEAVVGEPAAGQIAPGGLVAEPDSVTVTLRGTADALLAADTSAVRVRVLIAGDQLRDRLNEDGEVRVPVVVEGLGTGSWLEGATDVDTVVVRRASGS